MILESVTQLRVKLSVQVYSLSQQQEKVQKCKLVKLHFYPDVNLKLVCLELEPYQLYHHSVTSQLIYQSVSKH